MKQDHRENTVGPWAQQKLEALERYLEFYGTALKEQPSKERPFTRIYIDAFAGACVAKIRNSEVLEPTPFFDDPETTGAQAEFIVGSPIRALQIKNPFHKYYFFDMDQSRIENLRRSTEGELMLRSMLVTAIQ